MIIYLIGQPCSGKTTLSLKLQHQLRNLGYHAPIIDGDEMRRIMQNTDYTMEGRRKNMAAAFSTAKYLQASGEQFNHPVIPILALVSPYQIDRLQLAKGITEDLKTIYLHYKGEKRGREHFHVPDFEVPTGAEANRTLWVDTGAFPVDYCLEKIMRHLGLKYQPMKRALIRFNTRTTGDHDLWRVITPEGEVKCSHVIIDCPTATTADKVGTEEGFITKHHVTAFYTQLVEKDGVITLS